MWFCHSKLSIPRLTSPHFKKGDPYEKSNHNSNTNNDRIQCGPTGNPGPDTDFINSLWECCVRRCCLFTMCYL